MNEPGDTVLGGLDLGRVRVGAERTVAFRLTNSRHTAVSVTAPRVVAHPATPSDARAFCASLCGDGEGSGVVLEAGESVSVCVTFAPTAARVYRAVIDLSISGAHDAQQITLQGEGSHTVSASPSPPPPPPPLPPHSLSQEEQVRCCVAAIAELGRSVEAIHRSVCELSSSRRSSSGGSSSTSTSTSSRHVSWETRPSELEQRVLRLERALQTVTARLDERYSATVPLGDNEEGGGSGVRPAPESAVATTPLPRTLTREDTELLEAMGAAPGAPPLSTGKTPARWRDFVTGDAAAIETSPHSAGLARLAQCEATPLRATPSPHSSQTRR